MLVSDVQQSDPVIHTWIYIYIYIYSWEWIKMKLLWSRLTLQIYSLLIWNDLPLHISAMGVKGKSWGYSPFFWKKQTCSLTQSPGLAFDVGLKVQTKEENSWDQQKTQVPPALLLLPKVWFLLKYKYLSIGNSLSKWQYIHTMDYFAAIKNVIDLHLAKWEGCIQNDSY